MNPIDLVSRWVHVGTAIVLLGGATYIRFVLLPAARQLPDEAHQQLRALTSARWKKFVHAGIGLLLLTGFYNYLTAAPAAEFKKQYHMLIGIKMLIAFGVFFLASALAGRSKAFEKWRESPQKILGTLLVLGAVIVAISGYVKLQGAAAWKSAAGPVAVEESR